jgi:protein-disulfide isomerase
MRLLLAGAVLVALLPSAPAAAAEFTAQQRKEIVEIVREALKSDPSILREAVDALDANETDRQADAGRAAIAANHDALYGQSDPTGGTAQADVTIVEFLDPRCPYCRQIAPAMAMLQSNDAGIRVIYKDMANPRTAERPGLACAARAASTIGLPCKSRISRATSTIRIAFFADSAIRRTKPICV